MVRGSSKTLKTDRVVQYLLIRVQNAGTEPELLPGEMELCEKFQISRVTVRRAIETLISAGYILRLPKRRGAFSNPEMAKNIPFAIGIAANTGYTFSLDDSSGIAISGFIKKMGADEEHSYLYQFLNISPDDSLENILENNNIQGLLWISPDQSVYPGLNELIRRSFPVAVINTPFNSYYPALKKNCILRDFASCGVRAAEFLLKNGVRNPAYCGHPNVSYEMFVKTLKKNGIVFHPEHLLEQDKEIEKRLPELIRTGGIDSVYSTGSSNRYTPLVKSLSHHPEDRNIALFFEKSPMTQQYKKDYPGLKIHLNPNCTVKQYMYRAGEQAAVLLNALMKNPGTSVDTFQL